MKYSEKASKARKLAARKAKTNKVTLINSRPTAKSEDEILVEFQALRQSLRRNAITVLKQEQEQEGGRCEQVSETVFQSLKNDSKNQNLNQR